MALHQAALRRGLVADAQWVGQLDTPKLGSAGLAQWVGQLDTPKLGSAGLAHWVGTGVTEAHELGGNGKNRRRLVELAH